MVKSITQNKIKKAFDTLGITPNQDKKVIEKAYKKMALKTHPDKNLDPESTKKFHEVTSAKELLCSLDDKDLQTKVAQLNKSSDPTQNTSPQQTSPIPEKSANPTAEASSQPATDVKNQPAKKGNKKPAKKRPGKTVVEELATDGNDLASSLMKILADLQQMNSVINNAVSAPVKKQFNKLAKSIYDSVFKAAENQPDSQNPAPVSPDDSKPAEEESASQDVDSSNSNPDSVPDNSNPNVEPNNINQEAESVSPSTSYSSESEMQLLQSSDDGAFNQEDFLSSADLASTTEPAAGGEAGAIIAVAQVAQKEADEDEDETKSSTLPNPFSS